MKSYKLKPGPSFAVVPGHGRVRQGQVISGDLDNFVPDLLEVVVETPQPQVAKPARIVPPPPVVPAVPTPVIPPNPEPPVVDLPPKEPESIVTTSASVAVPTPPEKKRKHKE